MSLFGGGFSIPTPEDVRGRINKSLFGNMARFGSGAGQGAGAIGIALGQALAGATGRQAPGMEKAQKAQLIREKALYEFGRPLKTPQDLYEFGQIYGGKMIEGGFDQFGAGILAQTAAFKPTPSDRDVKFWEEERGSARQVVKSMESKAANLRSDYGKLEQLAKRAKGTGTSARAARNSMIANIVRLNSPGIVSEQELKTYTGGQGTTSAMLQFLQGKGVDTNSLMAHVDPSGATFDVDGMLGLGSDLILGQAQPIFDQIDDAKTRAQRAQLSERAQKTIFGQSKNIEALRKLATPKKDSSLDARAKALGL